MGDLVSIVVLHFQLQSCKVQHGQVEITRAMSSFFVLGIIHIYHVHRRTRTPLSVKSSKPGEPSDEHNPYAVAVLENVGEEQQVALAAPLASAL